MWLILILSDIYRLIRQKKQKKIIIILIAIGYWSWSWMQKIKDDEIHVSFCKCWLCHISVKDVLLPMPYCSIIMVPGKIRYNSFWAGNENIEYYYISEQINTIYYTRIKKISTQ